MLGALLWFMRYGELRCLVMALAPNELDNGISEDYLIPMTTQKQVSHFRIRKEARFIGGEFATYEDCARWARQHVGGFYVIVECDRYGEPLSGSDFGTKE